MSNYAHVMVDIETLSTENNALILTIGACQFDIETGEALASFYVKLNKHDGEARGLNISKSTLEWWEKQSEEARNEAFTIDDRTVPYKLGLEMFSEFLVKCRETNDRQKLALWANDPDFDCIKLMASFTTCDILAPWQYWEHKSCRTMDMIGEKLTINKKKDFPRTGTYHHALDDAKYQALIVSVVWGAIALK